MNGNKSKAYAARFKRVYDYIQQNLDKHLTLVELSSLAHFSRFHFHRQFAQYSGVTLQRYIQLMRLKRACYRLAFDQQERIIDIALEAHFENPESFSRAFKKTFGQTPSQFRKQPDWTSWHDKVQLNGKHIEDKTMDVKIVDFDQTRVALLEHRKSPALIEESIEVFHKWRKQSGLSPVKTSRTFGIVYDNPATTEADKFRFDLCGSVDEPVPQNPQQVKNGMIAGGRYALLRHHGSLRNIEDSVCYLYGSWLPQSGEECRDDPFFFHYLDVGHEVEEQQMRTDIYLPLRG